MVNARTIIATGLVLFVYGGANAQEERGAYLARIMDCGACHTAGYLKGQPDMTGSDVGFEIPGLGVFYPPNLTSDASAHGWSEEQIVTALRTGTRPDGRQLVPIMPWPNYAALTDEDAFALARFLKSTKPVANETSGPVSWS